MERLKDLAEKFRLQVHSGALKHEMLETVLDILRKLMTHVEKQETKLIVTSAVLQKPSAADDLNKEINLLLSLNEKLNVSTPDILEKQRVGPIESIKHNLGLNERFVFAHVFFNGKIGAFESFVEQLDVLGSYDEAINLLEFSVADTVRQYNPDTTDQFVELIRRRFSSK
ncbi:MAG: hypothetical protein CK547_06310 [Chitinophagaceae bacterium]|nr:MAG: hypothetical protein CK547_06310 [Chitinophagaceae bacterium]